MTTLHIVTGDRGGVGKTFLACTLAQYFEDKGIDLGLFDADRCNPIFLNLYKKAGCQEVIISEDNEYEKHARPAYLSAMEKQTLVDLPAQMIDPLKKWFQKNSLFEMAAEHGVNFTFWFVSNGDKYSLRLFEEYLSYFQDKANYVFVKNLHFCDKKAWKLILEKNKDIQVKMDKYGVKVVDLPSFELDSCRLMISEYNLTFGEAANSQLLDVFERQSVKTYMRKASEAFDNAGAIYKDIEVFSTESSIQKTFGGSSKEVKPVNGKAKTKIIAEELNNCVGPA